MKTRSHDFTDRTVLITGAASGIGRELTLRLLAEGATVAAVDRQGEPLAKLAAEVSGKPFASALADVTDRGSLRDAARDLQSRLRPIDLLIANAGVGFETSALDFKAEAVEEIIRVNLVGVANSIEAVLPGMIERGRGHLVAISSLASYRGFPKMAGYCASKAGVNALLDSLRLELRPLGIDVTTLCPGWIRTPLTANIRLNPAIVMDVNVAVNEILRAIRGRRVFHAFPARSVRLVRLLQCLPSGISDWLTERGMRRMKEN